MRENEPTGQNERDRLNDFLVVCVPFKAMIAVVNYYTSTTSSPVADVALSFAFVP